MNPVRIKRHIALNIIIFPLLTNFLNQPHSINKSNKTIVRQSLNKNRTLITMQHLTVLNV